MDARAAQKNPLKAARVGLAMRQADLALKVGVHQSQIARYEAGARPSPEIARRLAEALGGRVTEMDLLYPPGTKDEREVAA